MNTYSNSKLSTFLAALVYVFLVFPSILVMVMSFGGSNEITFPPHDWSTHLYARMADPASGWPAAFLRSTYIACCTVVTSLGLGVSAAYALERSEFRSKRLIEFLFLSPIFIPSVVLALGLYMGLSTIRLVGSMPGLVVSHTLVTTPFVIVMARSALRQVDPGIEVAARIMGASRRAIFLRVVLPQLRRTLFSASFLVFLLSFDEVVIAWFVGASSNPTLPVKMYSSLQWEVSPVLTAISSVLVVLTCIGCLGSALVRKQHAS
ncbi:ABC transporter permease [Caballeronia sp. ATUFL_M1_KS5A]|uniref:ABC transporter permease n=1 Tax=Caballeronia sp. ATUFL_M1_KS5A TaxID=2921778 RepID=UPI0020285CEC|nr:ABC transporter permease [Caballeronia sp. ATUFL_M1_KS5A]